MKTSLFNSQPSGKPPEMEGKCMRCGKPEHQPGQKCAPKNAKALGTIWGMEKFHYFLYGKEFTLETDHKPLVSMYKKHMVDISPRVQRLIVRSFPYQPFNVIYKKGKDIPVADALS